ncbi:MAG: hypothetical protein IJ711_00100 [Lachnospiraceae bacterium]|nr:hypothetical protein [Clostridia bacterium]MBR1691156.1 hypothetical protein [Lachnospiraceae bacterium]
MTKLEQLQKEIDKCNRKKGCDNVRCEYSGQHDKCPRLIAHMARMDYCRENNIPVERW